MADHWEVETIGITQDITRSIDSMVNEWLYKNPGNRPLKFERVGHTDLIRLKVTRRVVG